MEVGTRPSEEIGPIKYITPAVKMFDQIGNPLLDAVDCFRSQTHLVLNFITPRNRQGTRTLEPRSSPADDLLHECRRHTRVVVQCCRPLPSPSRRLRSRS